MVKLTSTPAKLWQNIEMSEDLKHCPKGCYAPKCLFEDIYLHMRVHGVTMRHKDVVTRHMYWNDRQKWHLIVSASNLDAFKKAMKAVPSKQRCVIRDIGSFVIELNTGFV